MAEEKAAGLDTPAYYKHFANDVRELCASLRERILSLKASGKKIAAYGASAKGSTLLNFLDLPHGVIEFTVDRSEIKQGHYMPGTGIRISAPEALHDEKPDYALLLTWNFAEEIIAQQKKYLQEGGCFIIPVPNIKEITA